MCLCIITAFTDKDMGIQKLEKPTTFWIFWWWDMSVGDLQHSCALWCTCYTVDTAYVTAMPPVIFSNTFIFCLPLHSFFSSFSSLSSQSSNYDLISSCNFAALSLNSRATVCAPFLNLKEIRKRKVFVDSSLCTNYCKVCVVDFIHFVRFVIIKVFLLWFPVTCWDKPERALQRHIGTSKAHGRQSVEGT
jgi:hypothetical protein